MTCWWKLVIYSQSCRHFHTPTSLVTPVTFLATATDAAMASALFGGRIR